MKCLPILLCRLKLSQIWWDVTFTINFQVLPTKSHRQCYYLHFFLLQRPFSCSSMCIFRINSFPEGFLLWMLCFHFHPFITDSWLFFSYLLLKRIISSAWYWQQSGHADSILNDADACSLNCWFSAKTTLNVIDFTNY